MITHQRYFELDLAELNRLITLLCISFSDMRYYLYGKTRYANDLCAYGEWDEA